MPDVLTYQALRSLTPRQLEQLAAERGVEVPARATSETIRAALVGSERGDGLPAPARAPARAEHRHRWSEGRELTRERVSASPCSTYDDHLWLDVILLQTCECGATRQLLVGFKNRRRRGDDYRDEPLGTPLQRSGTYARPKVIA